MLAAMNGRVGDRLEVLKESGSHVVAEDISSTRLMTDWLKPVNRTPLKKRRLKVRFGRPPTETVDSDWSLRRKKATEEHVWQAERGKGRQSGSSSWSWP
jgi:hypothetical protein